MASQGRAPGIAFRKDHTNVARISQGTLASTQRQSHVNKASSAPRPAAAGSSSRNDRPQGSMNVQPSEDARVKFRPDRPAGTQQTQRSRDGFVTPLYAARKSAPRSAPFHLPTSTELFVTAKSLPFSASSVRLLQSFVACYNPLDITFDDKGFTIVFPKTKQGSDNCSKCYTERGDSRLFGHQVEMKMVYNTYETWNTNAPVEDFNAVKQAFASSGTAHTARRSTVPSTPTPAGSTARHPTAVQKQNHQTARAPNTAPPNKGTMNTTLAEQIKPSYPVKRDSSHALSQTSPARSIARTDRDETASSLSGRTGSELSASKRPKCHICGVSGSEFEPLVNCSTCKRRYHRRCHEGVPAVSDADHRWQCDRCIKRSGQRQQLAVEQISSAKASAPKRPHPQSTNASPHTTASLETAQETRSEESPLKRRKVDGVAAEEATVAAKPAESANDHEPHKAGLRLRAAVDLTTNAPSSQDSQLDEAQRLVEDSFTAMENRPYSVARGRKLKLERRKIPQQDALLSQTLENPQRGSHVTVEKPVCPVPETTDNLDLLPSQQASTPLAQTVKAPAIGQVARQADIGSTAKAPAPTQKPVSTSTKPKLKAKRTRVSPKRVPCPSCRRIVEVFPDMPSSLCKDCRKKPGQARSEPEAKGPTALDEVRPVTSRAINEKPQNQADEQEADQPTMKSLRSDDCAGVRSVPVSEKTDTTPATPAEQDARRAVAQPKELTPVRQASGMPALSQVQASALTRPNHVNQDGALLSAQKTQGVASDVAVELEKESTLEKPPPEKLASEEGAPKGPDTHTEPSRPEQRGAGSSMKAACQTCRKHHKRCKHTEAQAPDANDAETLPQEVIESDTDKVADAEPPAAEEVSSTLGAQDIPNFGNWKERPIGTYQKLIEMAFSDHNGAGLQHRGVTKWVADTFPGYVEGNGTWVAGIGATMTMHTVPKGKRLWTKETFEKGHDGVGKGDWSVPVPEAFANFHHFDRDSRLAALGPRKPGDKRSHDSSPTLQKTKSKPTEVDFTEACAPVANNILAPQTKAPRGKRRDLNAAVDDGGVTINTPQPPVHDVADAEGPARVRKQTIAGEQKSSLQESRDYENEMEIDPTSPASAIIIGSSKETSRDTSRERSEPETLLGTPPWLDGGLRNALRRSERSKDISRDRSEPETGLDTRHSPPRLPRGVFPKRDRAPQDHSSDESNDEPYLRYSNRRSERSAAQQPAPLASTAAEPPASPGEDLEGDPGSEDVVEVVKDLYEVFPALRPNFPMLDRETKMAEIKARPTRKQIFGKPLFMSRLKPGAVVRPLIYPFGPPRTGLGTTSANV